MRYLQALVTAALTPLFAARSEAQNPVQPIFASCASSSNWVATERQVTFPARLIRDTSLSPAPKAIDRSSGVSVQFVVDTLGVPDTATVRILGQHDSALARQVRSEVGKWRFTPAIASACKVRQVVTTSLRNAPRGDGKPVPQAFAGVFLSRLWSVRPVILLDAPPDHVDHQRVGTSNDFGTPHDSR